MCCRLMYLVPGTRIQVVQPLILHLLQTHLEEMRLPHKTRYSRISHLTNNWCQKNCVRYEFVRYRYINLWENCNWCQSVGRVAILTYFCPSKCYFETKKGTMK